MARSPKDTFITVYGRKPVQEALDDPDLQVDKVVLADDDERGRGDLAQAAAQVVGHEASGGSGETGSGDPLHRRDRLL